MRPFYFERKYTVIPAPSAASGRLREMVFKNSLPRYTLDSK